MKLMQTLTGVERIEHIRTIDWAHGRNLPVIMHSAIFSKKALSWDDTGKQ